MTLPNTNLHEFPGAPVARHPKAIEPLQLSVPATTCGYHVDIVVKEISSPPVRQIMGTVFEDLLRLLECLNLIESHLRQIDAASETFAFFQIIHDEARALVKFISEDALSCEAMSEELSETLDGIAFAINHDLQRVFENQQDENSPDEAVVGQLFRAHDLLTNCLQQSTISLAITFDRDLDGTKLFDNSDMRYRQSIRLCEDISKLLELVEACSGSREEPAFARLSSRVELFRRESLEFLMYSDWPQFEAFCEKIQMTEGAELESVLHQFQCYLDTLFGQIRNRAVLANVFPIQFGANETTTWPTAAADPAPPQPVDPEDKPADWSPLAMAV
jgi:hypothetical protein